MTRKCILNAIFNPEKVADCFTMDFISTSNMPQNNKLITFSYYIIL